MNEKPAPIEDRAANIKERIRSIIDRGYEEMYSQFDQLHKRNIHDDDVVTALRQLHEMDILDGYAEWGEIDLREDDNTTMNPAVPDPGDATSYAALERAIAPGGSLTYTKEGIQR